MKSQVCLFSLIMISLIVTNVGAQEFPPVFNPGPFPTGLEPVRDDAPVDVTQPDGVLHEYTAYRGTPTVDGAVDDDPVWQQIPWTVMEWYGYNNWGDECSAFDESCQPGEWSGWDDLTGWFKMLWDDDHIYIATKRIDDDYSFVPEHAEDVGNIWQDDGFQIKIDTRPPGGNDVESPGVEAGFALIDFEEAFNVWMNATNSNKDLELAEGECESSIESCTDKAIYGVITETDTAIIETFEIAFIKWDEIFEDEEQMFSIMINDRDLDVQEGVLQWAQGIWNKTADEYGSVLWSGSTPPGSAVQAEANNTPDGFGLEQNYPNPFNPTTTITYTVPEAGLTQLCIFNTRGEEVARPLNQHQQSGEYSMDFDATSLTSGIYFYQLRSGKHTITKKMILMQ